MRARQVFPNNGFVNQLMQLEETLKHKPTQVEAAAGRFPSSSSAPASHFVPTSSLHPVRSLCSSARVTDTAERLRAPL